MNKIAPDPPYEVEDRLVSVTLQRWDGVLGAPLAIELGPRCTVLVGKNAAGKSVILESIKHGSLASFYRRVLSTLGPHTMDFELNVGGRRLSYSYEWQFRAEPEDNADETEIDTVEASILWSEVCRDVVSGAELWRVKDGLATFPSGASFAMDLEKGLLRLQSSAPIELPHEVTLVKQLMRGVRLLKAGVPRVESVRHPIRLYEVKEESRKKNIWVPGSDGRVISAMSTLITWHEKKRELFECVVSIAKRLGILEEVNVYIDELPQRDDMPSRVATITVDDYNMGYASDGTLRVLEIIIGLISPGIRILLLEEPETAIHPGLLRKLLAEIEAYSTDRQIVISTHSPIVVDWAQAGDLRIVERTRDSIQVEKLDEEQVRRITAYLDDDFSMSDVVYSGDWQ